MQKAILITFDGPSFEAMLFDAIDRAVKLNLSNTPLITNQIPDLLTSEQIMKVTGWAKSTFYQKVSKMPPNVVLRRGKRLLFDVGKFYEWLQNGEITGKVDNFSSIQNLPFDQFDKYGPERKPKKR